MEARGAPRRYDVLLSGPFICTTGPALLLFLLFRGFLDNLMQHYMLTCSLVRFNIEIYALWLLRALLGAVFLLLLNWLCGKCEFLNRSPLFKCIAAVHGYQLERCVPLWTPSGKLQVAVH